MATLSQASSTSHREQRYHYQPRTRSSPSSSASHPSSDFYTSFPSPSCFHSPRTVLPPQKGYSNHASDFRSSRRTQDPSYHSEDEDENYQPNPYNDDDDLEEPRGRKGWRPPRPPEWDFHSIDDVSDDDAHAPGNNFNRRHPSKQHQHQHHQSTPTPTLALHRYNPRTRAALTAAAALDSDGSTATWSGASGVSGASTASRASRYANGHTRCGRHSEEWLFGGWSFRRMVRGWFG